jgi:hypothetical protein
VDLRYPAGALPPSAVVSSSLALACAFTTVASVASVGCGGESKRACGVCAGYGDPVVAGNVASAAVSELSGIAASHVYSDVYYVEDDDPVMFDGLMVSLHAIDDTGKLLGNWGLDGARVGNLEDIDVAACPAGSCIYTGDVGNTSGDQSPYPIYRFAEPAIDRAGEPTTSLVTADDYETIWVEYPDGAPRDCEGVAVRPETGEIYLFEKKTGSRAAVFKVPPWPPGGTTRDAPLTMTYVGDLSLVPEGTEPEEQLLVGADFHPCEDKLLVRTYSHVYEYTLPAGAPFDAIVATAPVKVRNPGGSESIGYLWDGLGYLSIPEGANPPLTVVRCEEPEVDAGP